MIEEVEGLFEGFVDGGFVLGELGGSWGGNEGENVALYSLSNLLLIERIVEGKYLYGSVDGEAYSSHHGSHNEPVPPIPPWHSGTQSVNKNAHQVIVL